MQYNKQILQLLACFLALQMICAYPQGSTEQSQRLNAETEADIAQPEQLGNLHRFERTLGRLRRAVAELAYEEAADDMELAEINVFRPLFRYRAQVSRQVKNPRQQQFG